MHVAFKSEVLALRNPYLKPEVSFKGGSVVPYGTPGSVRVDAVLFDETGKIVIQAFDLKTGSANLSASRVLQIQNAIGAPVPVQVIRP